MGWGYYPPYVPVAERRAKAEREAKRLLKNGRKLSPVRVEGRKAIANTFWGQAWCENLEAYSDLASRLPRGRTYARNGSILDLQVMAGKATALVMGSELYEIKIKIKAMKPAAWQTIARECSGKIDSLVELLAGKLSDGVMAIMTRQGGGLFPAPGQIDMDCSCPDGAYMCKHLAAVLYGIGARLDKEPGLLFTLRGVDQKDLIAQAAPIKTAKPTKAKVLEGTDLAGIFGIELDGGEAQPRKRKKGTRASP